MTEQTEWRAEEYRWSGDPDMKAWAVIEYEAGTDTIIRHIAEGLDEPTARLIAAASAKERLCEDLADALELALLVAQLMYDTVRAHEINTGEELEADDNAVILRWVGRLEETRAALTKAGRAPQ